MTESYTRTEDGLKRWYKDPEFRTMHREDGPAYDSPSAKAWLINGKFHREDGPAIEWYTREGKLAAYAFYIDGTKFDRRCDWLEGLDKITQASREQLSYEL